MDIQQEKRQRNSIISVLDNGDIQLQNECLKRPFWLSADYFGSIDDFTFATMNVTHIEKLLNQTTVDTIIIGLDKSAFVDEALCAALYQKNVSIEVMNTRSACYAFNILLDEYRPVLLILL